MQRLSSSNPSSSLVANKVLPHFSLCSDFLWDHSYFNICLFSMNAFAHVYNINAPPPQITFYELQGKKGLICPSYLLHSLQENFCLRHLLVPPLSWDLTLPASLTSMSPCCSLCETSSLSFSVTQERRWKVNCKGYWLIGFVRQRESSHKPIF